MPDDDATRGKVADIYLDDGRGDLRPSSSTRWPEVQLNEAAKYVTDRGHPRRAGRSQDYRAAAARDPALGAGPPA